MPFSPPEGFNSISAERLLWEQFKNDKKSRDHEVYEKWREDNFQKWTEYNGFKFPGITYPK
jgi:hypothetical protein